MLCYKVNTSLGFQPSLKAKSTFSKYENDFLHLLGFYITQRQMKWFYLNEGLVFQC